jgi:seryl-tRNA synthetase
MLDPKFIRDNPDRVRTELLNRRMSVDLDRFLILDRERRSLRTELDEKRAVQNTVSNQIRTLQGVQRETEIDNMRVLKERIGELEEKTTACEAEYEALIVQFPNISFDDVPVGRDESGNVVLRKNGEPASFSFQPRDHVELGELHGMIDIERASKVSGTRFSYLKGGLVLLQFGIIQHALRLLSDEQLIGSIIQEKGLSLPVKPWIPVIPPVLIKPEAFQRMARLEPREERYYIPSDDLFLVGSAEHTLGSMHMDEVFDEAQLPIRYVGYSTSFRREAGSYGKDTRGILRVHQFDKVEIESFTLAEQSREEQELIVSLQERLVQSLGIPYQVVQICTGDMGAPDARQIDIECWMPSQGVYRETHTSDLNTDYQARRLQTKVRRLNGSLEFVHMNDATVCAIGRMLIAIMENYQQEDGSIVVPDVLRPLCDIDRLTVPKNL